MKTIGNNFKLILLCLTLLFCIKIHAQKEAKRHDPFVRVYSIEGEKIAKGRITFINDSVLGLKNEDKLIESTIADIGYIKSKRSGGHNVLVSSLVGGALLVNIGGVTSEEKTKTRKVPIIGEYEYTTGSSPSTGAAVGVAIGLAGGAAIGGITSAFKNSETYIIDGDMRKWKLFKEMIENSPFR